MAVRKIAYGTREIVLPVSRNEDHVRVGGEDPTVLGVRPANPDVAADRLECGEMGTGAVQAMVNFGTDTQDPQDPPGTGCQGIVDRFDERGQIIRCVVVDEDDLVVLAGQHFGDAVQADGRAFVEVIAVRIVTSVENDGEHSRCSSGRSDHDRGRQYPITMHGVNSNVIRG